MKKFETKELIYPVLVLCFSLLNISSKEISSLSNLNSIIGILGVILFFRGNVLSTKLLYFWTLSQVLIITPYLDFSQLFVIQLGFDTDNFGIYINILPLFFIGFLRLLRISSLKGKQIIFLEFRETSLGNVFPIKGTIIERVDIGNSKNNLIVELDKKLIFENEEVSLVLTKAKDDDQVTKLGKNQIAHFRIIKHMDDIKTKSLESFPFIDWVRIQ